MWMFDFFVRGRGQMGSVYDALVFGTLRCVLCFNLRVRVDFTVVVVRIIVAFSHLVISGLCVGYGAKRV